MSVSWLDGTKKKSRTAPCLNVQVATRDISSAVKKPRDDSMNVRGEGEMRKMGRWGRLSFPFSHHLLLLYPTLIHPSLPPSHKKLKGIESKAGNRADNRKDRIKLSHTKRYLSFTNLSKLEWNKYCSKKTCKKYFFDEINA